MLETDKLVLLMRSLNERAMRLNEEGKTKSRAESVSRPVEGFYRGIASHVIYYHTLDPTLLSDFLYKNP